MSDEMGQLEGLKGFEQLDLGELYFLGGRKSVERGLAYFRQFAVESLEWDARSKRITAMVSGSQRAPYEVTLCVRDGRLEHECDCPAWGTYDGSCKHVIAATAAVFMATQGKFAGGVELPEDYVQELRQGLGYAKEATTEAKPLEKAVRPKTTLLLAELNRYCSLQFRVKGPVPQKFLRSVGITLANDFGYYGSREFWLGDPGRSLQSFIHKAQAQGVELQVKVHGQSRPLTWGPEDCRLRIEYDFVRGEVLRRVRVNAAEGETLVPYALIESSQYVLLESGEVCQIASADGLALAGDRGPLYQAYEPDAFNGVGYRVRYRKDPPDLLIDGKRSDALELHPEAVRCSLDLGIWKNAAREPEELEFTGAIELDGCKLVLEELTERCLAPLVTAYAGGLFSAKRRVRALLELIRCLLADGVTRAKLDLSDYRVDFPELTSNEYRGVVHAMLANLLSFLESFPEERYGIALNAEERRWCAYPLDVRQFAMLLFSMADLTSRKDLLAFAKGKIPIVRGTSGIDQVKRVVSAARVLGVEVRFDEKPIHSEQLTISVDTQTSGTDIDWFALHPSIRCGEQTIEANEWQQLVRGQLMLTAKDGSLILPDVPEEGEAGLQVLASMLRQSSGSSARSNLKVQAELQVSRLEMLDWLMLRKHGVTLRLPPEAEELFESLASFDQLDAFEPPKSLQADLRPYQLEGSAWIEFLYQHRFGACLADDMGLGKTVQAIAFIAKRLEESPAVKQAPVLIVVPPSLVFNWLDEFARFAPSLKVVDCLKQADWAPAIKDAQVVLTTYDRVRVDQGTLSEYTFDIVVFDEAHNLKSVTAARTKAATKLQRRFTLCLTGTPVENNASEFYSVLSASVPGIFGTLQSFKDAFRQTPDRILGRSKPFILRRTKQAILTELPKKEEHELFLEMSSIQKEIYTRTVAEVREEVAEAYADRPDQQAGIVALAAILRLRQVCVSPELMGKRLAEPAPKFQYMADKLEELEAEGHSALVFSQFIGGLDQMELIAQTRGIKYLRMDGKTPVAERKEIVRAFQSGKGPSFFFISLKTGGVGLNLTRANYVFHLDPWWNPAVENQASDRAHRIGQTRSVFVQRLIMQHSIEARMLELKARKAELFRQLVEQPGEHRASAGLSREDFDYLLNG